MINDRILLMLKLKDYLTQNNEEFKEIKSLSERNNAWFTQEFIHKSIDNICNLYLDENEMIVFASYIKTKEELNKHVKFVFISVHYVKPVDNDCFNA